MLGYDPSGRGFLLPRPTREEEELQLWSMLFTARTREEEMKQECKERDEEYFKKERDLKDWESRLEIRELKLGNADDGITKMMRELRVRETEIETRDEEIKSLKNEIEEQVMGARAEHKREMKVVLVYV